MLLLPLNCASAHIAKQLFIKIWKENKMQKNREDRAGFSSWGYEPNPSFTKLLENLGKLVWCMALWSSNSSSSGNMAAVAEKDNAALHQLRKSGFRCIHPALCKHTFSDWHISEVRWKHGLCQGRHIRSNQILLLSKSACTSSVFQFEGLKGSVASKAG